MARVKMYRCLQHSPEPRGSWRGLDDLNKMLDAYINSCGRDYVAAQQGAPGVGLDLATINVRIEIEDFFGCKYREEGEGDDPPRLVTCLSSERTLPPLE
jgi:hypothetical protein